MNPILTAVAPAPATWSWEWWLAMLIEIGYNVLAVAGIIIGAFILAWLLRFVIRRVVNRIVSGAQEQGQRRRHAGARSVAARVGPGRPAHQDSRVDPREHRQRHHRHRGARADRVGARPDRARLAHAAHGGDRRRSRFRGAEHREGRPQRHLHRRRRPGGNRRCRRPRPRLRDRGVRERARDPCPRCERHALDSPQRRDPPHRQSVDGLVPGDHRSRRGDGCRHRPRREGDARHGQGLWPRTRSGARASWSSPRCGAWSRSPATRSSSGW